MISHILPESINILTEDIVNHKIENSLVDVRNILHLVLTPLLIKQLKLIRNHLLEKDDSDALIDLRVINNELR